MGERGHVKPDNYLDSHAKFLVGVATKGGTVFMFFCLGSCDESNGFIRLIF